MLKSSRRSNSWQSYVDGGHSLGTMVNKSRLYVIAACFLAGFCMLAFRVVDIVFIHNIKYETAIVTESNKDIHRADIVDRNGVFLAVNLASPSLYANPRIIIDPKEAATKLCKIFKDLEYKTVLADLSSSKSFVWIKRNLAPKEQFEVNNLGIPGLSFEYGERRVYPHGSLLAHILGYVGIDGHGLAGLEKHFDSMLMDKEQNGESQKHLQLSIDLRVQNIVSEELYKAMNEFNAIGGVGVVMDINNGEILSSVSLPSFDPHNPGQASNDQLFNRFSLGLYEPGSTFKTYTFAMALDNKTITLADSYNVDSPIKAAKYSINDYHAKGGWLTIPEIFMYSSNIGTAKISLDMGREKQQSYLKSFGLMDPIEMELPERATPIYPSRTRWSELSMMTISYGHGIAVTPLHLIRVAGAMINGGRLMPLTYVKRDASSTIPVTQVIKPETSEQIRKLYRLVVEKGTGRKADIPGYLVGGKTGTAEKAGKGGYNHNSRLSSFLAAFPIHDPKYIIVVMLDEPKGTKATGGYATAGMTAAPVAGNIISRIGPLFDMPAVDLNDPQIKEKLWIEFDNLNDELNSL